MKKLLAFLWVALMTAGSALRAQEAETSEATDLIPDIYLDSRVGYTHELPDGTGRFGATGLYLDINGYLSPRLSYSFNQILAADYFDVMPNGFDATQWLNFTYEVSDFAFTMGKLSSNVGNYEYDADVLDAYFDMNSMFYNMFDCYQWGLQADWYPSEDHSLIFQFTNSPLSTAGSQFAYNLAWRGDWGCYQPYWSANLWQFGKGEYMKGINFGNRFQFNGLGFDLEYMARAADMKTMFRDDFNLIFSPSYSFGEWVRLFGKFGWEHTSEELPYDLAYEEYKGGDYIYYGAGIEVFPFAECRDVRLHAYWSGNNYGDNLLNIGLRWKFDITSSAKKLLGRISDN